MDPSLHLENQSIDEFVNWELDNGARLEITYPHQNLDDVHSFEEQSIGGAHLLQNLPLKEAVNATSFVDTEDDNHNDRGNGPRLEITYPHHQEFVNIHLFQEQSIGGVHLLQNQPFQNEAVNSTSFVDTEDDNHNDRDLSGGILRYIDQILMEEDMESDTHLLQESFDFQAKERSFYEVLGKKYPPSPPQESPSPIDVVDRSWRITRTVYDAYRRNYIVSNSPIFSLSNLNNVCESQVVWNFRKGVVGVSKSRPRGRKMLGMNCVDNDVVKIESSHFKARGKKHLHIEEIECEEESSNKLPVVKAEPNVPIVEFDDVWIYTIDERETELATYVANLQIGGIKTLQQGGTTGRCGKKQNNKTEVIDLTSLLIRCAQYVSGGNHHTANKLLQQIRQHSSPTGDARQRLAHYFADGLEARLAGTGSETYKALVHTWMTIPDSSKSYFTFLVSSPFRKILNFASNNTFIIKSEKATRVHIIDFGMFYGFQWPSFIQRVAERKGGPPKLRITGVDFPQSGSRPAERIEETGHRLAHYAKMFNVPFEYNAIAQSWETIKIEDLKIEKGEFVAVILSFRGKHLIDASDVAECSKTKVLDLIRKMNPDIFIHGIVNGGYSRPFFVPRFREALSHFSALFDYLETIAPGDKPERMLIERDVFAKEAFNVIVCEGTERVERPETYNQWQKRHLRAGFTIVPFDRKLMGTITYKVINSYHREFVIDEDKQWLLMSWKGRVLYALSCWQPV